MVNIKEYLGDLESEFVRLEKENKKLKEILKNEGIIPSLTYSGVEVYVKIPLGLLEDIRHEFISLNGLYSFDKCRLSDNGLEIELDDLFHLDFTKLIEKIDKVSLDEIDSKIIDKNHRIEYLEKELNKVKSLLNYKISDITVSDEYGDVHEDLTMFAQQVLINLKKDMGW